MSAAELRWSLLVDRSVESTFGYLFGGCALGEAIAGMEQLTARRCLSAHVRFVRFAKHATTLDLVARVSRSGARVTHAETVATDEGGDIVAVTGAFVPAETADAVVVEQPPAVALSSPAGRDLLADKPGATAERCELRAVDVAAAPAGRRWIWASLRDRPVASAADLAVLADMLPILPHVLDRPVMANTVDMTLRPTIDSPTERVLMEFVVPTVATGFGHIDARMWGADGRCLGTTSQSYVVQSWAT